MDDEFRTAVRRGLSAEPKALSPKWLYDGVARDVEAGLEAVLQAHPRDLRGVDRVPGARAVGDGVLGGGAVLIVGRGHGRLPCLRESLVRRSVGGAGYPVRLSCFTHPAR